MSTGSAWINGRTTSIGAIVAALLVGCVVDGTHGGGSGGGFVSGGGSAGRGSGPATGGGATGQPLLVEVDPNQTLTAAGGDGVGVFTEYKTGGHWHVWWTCDTNATRLPCSFQIDASATSGTLTNVVTRFGDGTDQISQPNSQQIQAVTLTQAGIDDLVFDAPPGAVVTLDVMMNGQRDGAFLFFAQANMVKGGYQGTLSDPLMFEPSSP